VKNITHTTTGKAERGQYQETSGGAKKSEVAASPRRERGLEAGAIPIPVPWVLLLRKERLLKIKKSRGGLAEVDLRRRDVRLSRPLDLPPLRPGQEAQWRRHLLRARSRGWSLLLPLGMATRRKNR
jgi:hypothetical protein